MSVEEDRDFWRASYEEESELRGEAQAEVRRLRALVANLTGAVRRDLIYPAPIHGPHLTYRQEAHLAIHGKPGPR